MNAIFLDVDGVLNSMRTPAWMGDDWDIPLAKHLYQLKRIVDETGAKIVISSSWREHAACMRKLDLALKVFELPIYSITPHMNLNRALEIKTWLAEHPEIDRFVILDDDRYYFEVEYCNKLVLTSPAKGLTAKEADLAIALLTDDDIWRN